MILTGKQILKRNIITPSHERTRFNGLTYGAGVASYDIRLAETIMLRAGNTTLASSIEHFNMPKDLCAHVRDKSSWARIGVHSFNTHIDPGWRGYLTLELCYIPLLYVLDKEGSKWHEH